jgi:4-amino-4-deoxy-L-arabinose transferase-like glycosyltransferase
MVARNFYYDGIDLLHPKIYVDGANPQYYWVELHLYPAIVSVVYWFAGGVYEVLGRIVSIIFSLGTIALLYLLAKKYFGETAGLVAAGFYAFAPAGILFGRTFQPEAMMVFFSVAAIYFFTEWVEKSGWKLFAATAFCTAVAFLVKPPTMYLFVPLFYVAYAKYGKKVFVKPALWLFFALVVIPIGLWLLFLSQVTNTQEYLSTLRFENYGGWGVSELRNPLYYKNMLESVAGIILTPMGFAVALLGVFVKPRNKFGYVFHAWLLAVIAYFVILAGANMYHNYYQLPLLPVAAVFVGAAAAHLLRKECVKGTFLNEKWAKIILVMVFLALSAFYVAQNIYIPASVREIPAIGREVQEIAGEKDSVIASYSSGLAMLYYTDRMGWPLWINDPDHPAVQALERLRAKGAKYFVAALTQGKLGGIDVNDVRTNQQFYDYLKTNYQLVRETPNYLAFGLD